MDTTKESRQASTKASGPRQAPMLPAELMQALGDGEQRQYDRYRWRALRFLAYQPGLSRLMQALAGESQARLVALAEALAMEPPPLPDSEPWPWRYTGRGSAHFFIVDDDMARLELARCLLEEHRMERCYARLAHSNAIPELDALLNDGVARCRAHCQLLDETRQSLPTRHRALGSAARGRRRVRRIG